MKRYYAVGMVLFFCTTIMYFSKSRNLKNDISVLEHSKIKTDSLDMWRAERLLIYTQISLKQANIINKYKSSRDAKLNDKELRDLQQKLN
mgnify:CR=1 FL=1